MTGKELAVKAAKAIGSFIFNWSIAGFLAATITAPLYIYFGAFKNMPDADWTTALLFWLILGVGYTVNIILLMLVGTIVLGVLFVIGLIIFMLVRVCMGKPALPPINNQRKIS